MPKKIPWLWIAYLILIVEFGAEFYATVRIIHLHMIPTRYIAILVLVFVLCFLKTASLVLWGIWKLPEKLMKILKRSLAVVLAVVVSAASIGISYAVSKLDNTVTAVTKIAAPIQAVVGVYVMADDPAVKMADAADYTFGTLSDMDTESTDYALSALEEQLGKPVTTVSRPTIVENVSALYGGQIDGIIVNESYTDLLDDTEDYADFSSKTRILTEIEVPKNTSDETEVAASSDNSTKNSNKDKESSKKSNIDVTKDCFIMYVSGSDTRSATLDSGRSDVNILMVVNPTTKQILLINTPRDYYIGNPAGDYALDKLTHCGVYGINNSVEALENLYAINIDYYCQMNFTGFETLIDAIGGVTVDSSEAFSYGGFSFIAGSNEMSGEEALAFARDRYSFSDGDNSRGKNQMKIIEAVLNKLTSGTTLLRNYSDILNSLEGMFATDMSADEIDSLVKMQLNDMSKWTIQHYSVTGLGTYDTTYSMPESQLYVMNPDYDSVDKARNLISTVQKGETLTDDMFN